jgi:hypothetical protein
MSSTQINPFVFVNPSNKNEMYMEFDKTLFRNTTGGVENSVWLTADSFYIGSGPILDAPDYTKFRVSNDGNIRIPRFKNNITEDSVLTTDQYGNLKSKILPKPFGLSGWVQFNNGVTFSGDPAFTWDAFSRSLNIAGIDGQISLSGANNYITLSNANPGGTSEIYLSNDQAQGFGIFVGGSEFTNKTVLSGALPIEITSDVAVKLTGKNMIGGSGSPTAKLHIAAGGSSPNTAPIKLTNGSLLTTPENGAIEFNGTHYFVTVGSTRYQLDQILKGTLSFDFPSVADNSSTSTTVNIAGAAIGDFVDITTNDGNVWLNGETYTGWVSSTNIVTVRLNNNSNAPIDLATRNFNIIVRKY